MKQLLRAKIQKLRNIEHTFENPKTIYLISCGILLANTIIGYSEIVRGKITQKDRTNAKKKCVIPIGIARAGEVSRWILLQEYLLSHEHSPYFKQET